VVRPDRITASRLSILSSLDSATPSCRSASRGNDSAVVCVIDVSRVSDGEPSGASAAFAGAAVGVDGGAGAALVCANAANVALAANAAHAQEQVFANVFIVFPILRAARHRVCCRTSAAYDA
jgi:hypothetical protein